MNIMLLSISCCAFVGLFVAGSELAARKYVVVGPQDS